MVKVEDYIKNTSFNGGVILKYKSLENLILLPKEHEKLEVILGDCLINHYDREEKLIWKISKDGIYKVKER